MSTSPVLNTERLSAISATISVPSREPPARIIRPTPRPSIMPPNIAAKNGSLVTFSIGANISDQKESKQTAIIVETAKLLPICL